MSLPEIRIQFSWLLFENVSQELAKLHNVKLRERDWYVRRAAEYRQEWEKKEEVILTGMQEALGLEFYRPVIDAYLAPYMRPQSSPLILSYKYEPDQFVDLMIHELFHVLITDNKTYYTGPGSKFKEIWNTLYKGEDMLVRNHIWVHAGLKYIFLDVMNEPARLKRDIEQCQGWPGYKRAWEIVEADGYKELIAQLKALYPQFTSTS